MTGTFHVKHADGSAADARVERAECGRRAGAFGGIALACNRESRAEVDATLIRAVAAGGRALRAAQPTFWGGYSGYVADPDGHAWEIAHNPGFPMDENGRITLPE